MKSIKLNYAFGLSVLSAILLLRYETAVERLSVQREAFCMYAIFTFLILYYISKNKRFFLRWDPLGAVMALTVSLSIIATPYLRGQRLVPDLPQLLLQCFFLLAFFYFLFLCLWDIATNKMRDGKCELSLCQVLFMAMVFIVILAIQYKPLYPSGSSPDALNQWQQIHGELNYNKIHAIGHTIFLKGLLNIYDGYLIVILFHLVGVLCVYLCFASRFRKKGFSIFALTMVFGLALISSSASSTAYYYPWKDTPYALCVCVVTLCLMDIQEHRLTLPQAFLLGLALAWCQLFRLNGIIILLVCGCYFAIAFIKSKHYKHLALMMAAILLSVSFVNVYSAKVLKPTEYKNGFSIQPFVYGIAAMVDSGQLTQAEMDEIDALVSVEWMQENYATYAGRTDLIWKSDQDERILNDINLEFFNNGFVLDAGEHRAELIALYFRLMPKHLLICIKDILASLFVMWRCEEYFLKSYLFAFLLTVFMAIKAKLRFKDSVVFLPSICNTVSIMISTTTNEARYFLPMFMLAPVFFLYISQKKHEYQKI